ncbi:hypothetical protein VNO77_17316 [Canavalia gladiata]|uniref:Uncharacterized protein n=1 Tax=Canavalia gladiata TaxID=3824 RepID=A0AAN9QIL5_CANGL
MSEQGRTLAKHCLQLQYLSHSHTLSHPFKNLLLLHLHLPFLHFFFPFLNLPLALSYIANSNKTRSRTNTRVTIYFSSTKRFHLVSGKIWWI